MTKFSHKRTETSIYVNKPKFDFFDHLFVLSSSEFSCVTI